MKKEDDKTVKHDVLHEESFESDCCFSDGHTKLKNINQAFDRCSIALTSLKNDGCLNDKDMKFFTKSPMEAFIVKE